MLTVYRDLHGAIQFVAESRCVDADGNLADDGAYLWVEQIECNPTVSAMAYIRRLMLDLTALMPHLQWTYWLRRDSTGNTLHGLYSRAQIVRWACKREEVLV